MLIQKQIENLDYLENFSNYSHFKGSTIKDMGSYLSI